MKRLMSMILCMAFAFSFCACKAGEQEPRPETDRPAASPRPDAGGPELMNAVRYPDAISFEDYEARRDNREQNAPDERFLAGMDDFAFHTAAAVLGLSTDNANYSPLSLYLALALGATGAEGQTQREMLSLLGVDDEARLRDQCAKLYRFLYTDNEISKLKIANSLWLDNEVQGQRVAFSEAFCKAAADDFYASVFGADFASEDTGLAMSQWVSENTNGTLSPGFEADPDKLLSILNTVYFYDEWTDAFNESSTAPGTFHAPAGDVRADFMNRTTSGSFTRGDGFTRSSLGLKNMGGMLFILPDEGVSVQDLMRSDDSVKALFQGGTEDYGEVIWSLPKFSYGCRYDLADTLRQLGMASAFDPETADFSAITDAPAWLSSVTQQTHIAIDERGVEASAYTELGYAGAGLPQSRAEMILDRPFIYGITSSSGVLLFMGVCFDPTAVS